MRSGMVTFIIALSLLSVSLFGIFGLSMANYDSGHACPISALSNNDCSSSNGPLAEAFHHISGLQNFSQGALNQNTSLILSVLLAIVLTLFGLAVLKTPPLQAVSFKRVRYDDITLHQTKRQFLRWLALHQKRDRDSFKGA